MVLPNRISAVIFDMDGTLHDTEVVYAAALKGAVEAVGFAVTEAFCHSLIGIPDQEGDLMLRHHLGPQFPFDAYKRCYRDCVEHALASAVPAKPGATEVVGLLANCGFKLAIATSAVRERAKLQLGRSGLLEHFPVLVTRDDVDHGKPHPDLFLFAAKKLGVPPEECLAIEDSHNGIRAAHAAGMMPIMVPDLVPPSDEIAAMCVHIVSDLRDAGAIITRHWSNEP